ncbi:alpha-hydroxy acid oxidase [Noviherbaspirillum sp. 1P10PC]|uniref:alpha-hydroxy acid oxidase n=1 Tax=Noviherbaspirillum sp. 1P10PC TaxID=3132292 RepID=UPI00399EF72B
MSTTISSIFDLESLAKKRLPEVIFDYVHGGAEQQITLQRNVRDLQALALRQHDMRDVSDPRLSTTMAGEPARIPLAIGPTGLAGLTWPNGECEEARAAAEFGVPYCLSTMSICSIEDVAQACEKPFWFQLYLMKKREVNEHLIRRARDAQCPALVLTLDLHVQGKRWADAKNGLSVPPKLTLHNMLDIGTHPGWLLSMARSRRRTFGNLEQEVQQAPSVTALSEWVESQFDPSFDLDTVKWVRRLWDRKLILKGIMHPDDARLAVDVGADAIIVSNHGGRQLDGAPSSISVLPAIADAVQDRIEVLFDGGIRTGSDIVKALGRGAHACLSGRACLYGLAAEGKEGVLCALNIFEQEMKDCMALVGIRDLCSIDRGVVTAQPAI